MYAVQPLLPIFTREFHIDAATSSLALSVTTGCLAVSMLVIGAVAEGWSRKPLMSASLLGAALLTLASSVVTEWPTFLFIRAVEGIAIAGLPALAMAYLGEEIHPDDVGVSMGLYVGSGALGGMTGRLLTGLMTDLFSWRPTLAAIRPARRRRIGDFSVSLPASAQFRPRSLSMHAARLLQVASERSGDPRARDGSRTRARHAGHRLQLQFVQAPCAALPPEPDGSRFGLRHCMCWASSARR